MERIYVDSIREFELQDLIDELIMNAEIISDRGTKEKYLKIGSGFDIETSKIKLRENDYGIPSVSFCYHWQFGFGNYAIMGRNLETMRDFFIMLISSMNALKPETKLMVLDANLGYEWQFCKHYWADIGISKVFAKEERDPLYIEVANTLMFREVIGLFGFSLAQIAENYCGINKLVGDLDYDKVRFESTKMTDAEIGYCVRDVEILVVLAEKHIFENYMGKNPRLPLTKTGIVRDAIKRAYGKELKNIRKEISSWMPTESEYELFRQYLFKGGISGGNILLLNKKLKNVRGADITSDYPYQMENMMFPMGGAEVCDRAEFLKEKIPYIAVVRFRRFKSRNAHSLMSAHKVLNKREMQESEFTILDNNRIQYGEVVELIINDVEYKALKRAYKWDRATVIKCWKFKKGYALLPKQIRDVCTKQYMIKQALKPEHSETLDYKQAKEFVNSIYGMMCTALYMEEFIFDEQMCSIESDMSAKTYEEACKYLFLSPYWGFWVTSYARAMLMDVITRFPDVIVQYDTDSVYFIDDGREESEKLKKYLENENKRMRKLNNMRFLDEPLMESLGTWDFTEKFKCFKGLGSKRYMYEKQDGEIKVVIAGCRKNKDTKRSTVLEQCDYNNKKNSTKIDYFDFFSDGMYIDKKHSCKLASRYIDVPCRIKSPDGEIYIPSCVVLEPVDFTMSMSNPHKTLMIASQRFINNTRDRQVYDLWRSLKKLATSTTTPLSELIMTGDLSPKSTKS